MSRTRRTSRWLIAVTAVVLALGLTFWFSKRSTLKKAASAPATQPVKSQLAPAPILAAVTVAPVANTPATQPAPGSVQAPQPLVMTTPGLAAPGNQPSPQAQAPMNNVQLALNAQPAGSHPAASAMTVVPLNVPATQPARAASTQPLVDAKAKIDANQLLDARGILNDALAAGKLSDADAAAAKEMMKTINQTVIFSKKHFPDDEYVGNYVVKDRDRLKKIGDAHEVPWELLAKINNIDASKMQAGRSIKVIKGPFHAVVNKKKFTIELYLGAPPGERGALFVTSFAVGLGKDDSTPTGVWMCNTTKTRKPVYYSPRNEGVIEADDPANPLGGYWIGLTGIDGQAVGAKSYGIHGTIHPESIGKMESMGCIRLKNEDIAQVFDLLVPEKSMVVVKD